MSKKINSVLEEVLKKVKPQEEKINEFEIFLKEFLENLKKRIKSSKLDIEIFIGGSFAKKTVIKKKIYDIDIFLRFDKKYNEEISDLTEKLLKGSKKTKIHGSRDYFKIKVNPYFFLEIVPVIKIKKPEEAKNITDLSFFHVNYIKRRSPKKILDDIILTKAFCHANNCYGAESYIKGFSGYGLELLIYHYKSFLRFLKEMEKINLKEKTIIDIEKKFKNKQEILMNLNSSKLQSPIILIDPTYKQRNALAALSEETLKRFQISCKRFLKNPSTKTFESRILDLEKIKKDTKKRKLEFILIEGKTKKQEGDIAGSKLLKFHNYLNDEIKNLFYIKNKGFQYDEGKSGKSFFVVKSRKEVLYKGPKVKDKKNSQKFRKKHKKTFFKSGRIYAKEKIKFNIKEFLENWKKKNKKIMKEMYISELRVVK